MKSILSEKKLWWFIAWTVVFQIVFVAAAVEFSGMYADQNYFMLIDYMKLADEGMNQVATNFLKFFVPLSYIAGTIGISQIYDAFGLKRLKISYKILIFAIDVILIVIAVLLTRGMMISPLAICEVYFIAAWMWAFAAVKLAQGEITCKYGSL